VKEKKKLSEIVKEKRKRLREQKEDDLWRREKSKGRIFLERRLQLIIRDPLGKKLIEEFKKLPLPHDDWPEEIQNLNYELLNKWNVHIRSTRDQKYRYALAGWPYDERVDPEGKYPLVIGFRDRILEPIRFHHYDTSLKNFAYETRMKEYPSKAELIISKHGVELFPIDEKLLIEIDLNLIDLNDARYVKKDIWEYIERCIKKRKQEGKRTIIFHEPAELLPLYHIREATFNNYLRWYDIHTTERFTFRLIALIEKIRKNNPQRAEEILEKLKSKKIRWGNSIKGEDAVEKGIKLIYKAIHRTDYSQKKIEPLIEEYICPKHESDCPVSCTYHKTWLGRFNRLMPSF
jgi:hypothetical protein